MTRRENYLRAVEFRGPKWIPCVIYAQPVAWQHYRDELMAVAQRHPTTIMTKEQRDGLKPRGGGVEPGSIDYDDTGVEYRKVYGSYRAGDEYTDNWGTTWRNISGGLSGQTVGYPLSQWEALDSYQPPDPLTQGAYAQRDSWEYAAEIIEQAKQRGEVAIAPAYPDDRFFERLQYLRGFENLMIDLLSGPPQLSRLIDMIVDYSATLARKWTQIGAGGARSHRALSGGLRAYAGGHGLCGGYLTFALPAAHQRSCRTDAAGRPDRGPASCGNR